MAQRPETEAKMDATSLYREEIITDRKVGTLRIMTPLTTDGTTRRRARPALHGRSADHDRRGPAADQLRDRSEDACRSGGRLRPRREGSHRAHRARSPGNAAPGRVVDRRSAGRHGRARAGRGRRREEFRLP